MQGYLVDPETETVNVVELTDDYRDIYKLIDCTTFDIVHISGNDGLFVDDEGLYNAGAKVFLLDVGRPEPIPLVGKALLLGCDLATGESTDKPATPLPLFLASVIWAPHLRVSG